MGVVCVRGFGEGAQGGTGEVFTGMALGGCSSGPCDGTGASAYGRKGAQGGAWVVGGGGRSTQSGGGKK